MRTTLDIDADVLDAVKELAKARNQTAGRVLSDLARQSICREEPLAFEIEDGLPILPAGGSPVTVETVESLENEVLVEHARTARR